MSSMANHVVAASVMHAIFEKIKHGDEKHQAWLKEECVKLVPYIESCLDNAAQRERDSLNALTLAFIKGTAGYPSKEIDEALSERLDNVHQNAVDRFVDALNGDFSRVSPALKSIIQGHLPKGK